MKPALLLLAGLMSACGIPDSGPGMHPGEDCMQCHGGGGDRPWTVAGTVYSAPSVSAIEGLEGVKVHVTDVDGKQFTLRSNFAGNFYLAESLNFPIQVELEGAGPRVAMNEPLSDGSCNSCHSVPSKGGVPGRVFLP